MPMPDGTSFYDASDESLIEYCGDDARRWAEAFVEVARKHGAQMPVDPMVTWFANAIEAAYDVRTKRNG